MSNIYFEMKLNQLKLADYNMSVIVQEYSQGPVLALKLFAVCNLLIILSIYGSVDKLSVNCGNLPSPLPSSFSRLALSKTISIPVIQPYQRENIDI